jgi:hypothetical protein
MAGLVSAIHVFFAAKEGVDGRDSAAVTIAGCEGAPALRPFSRSRTAVGRARQWRFGTWVLGMRCASNEACGS